MLAGRDDGQVNVYSLPAGASTGAGGDGNMGAMGDGEALGGIMHFQSAPTLKYSIVSCGGGGVYMYLTYINISYWGLHI